MRSMVELRGLEPLTFSLRRHGVDLTRREHRVIDMHSAAAEVPGCNLGAHMGHTAASIAEAPLAMLCQPRGCVTTGKVRHRPVR
jgi:hypothetical protein